MSKKTIDETTEVEDVKKERKSKNKTMFSAMGYAINGIISAFKTERNLRIHYLTGICVFLFSLFFDFTKAEFACLCLTIGFVIFAEMMNTAVEAVVDLLTDVYNPHAKIAKDVAAGGVLISAGISVVVAYFLFIDKLTNATTVLLDSILGSPMHILVTILFIVVIAIIILKGIYTENNKRFAKSFPSFKVAISCAMAMYAWIISKSEIVGAISFILCFMIAQTKMQRKATTIIQIILSGLLGVLLVIIVFQLVELRPLIV
ncbi:MAG: diacylglycerol kinase [Clostridia bacterium]